MSTIRSSKFVQQQERAKKVIRFLKLNLNKEFVMVKNNVEPRFYPKYLMTARRLPYSDHEYSFTDIVNKPNQHKFTGSYHKKNL